jgi:glycosyltransferase involved in cell wall biosynthesis
MDSAINVIIPAHIPTEGHLRLLCRAMLSLQNQTYQDFRIILVLNGSFCDTQEVKSRLLPFKYFDRLVIYDMESKASGAAARNYGIMRSQSKYIAQLDADDQYMPRKLEKQVEFMENHPDCDFLGTCSMIYCSDGRTVEEEMFRPELHGEIARVIHNTNVMACGSILFRGDVFRRFGVIYNEVYKPGTVWPSYGRKMHEDWDLWIRLIGSGAKAHILQEKLYVWSEGTSVER